MYVGVTNSMLCNNASLDYWPVSCYFQWLYEFKRHVIYMSKKVWIWVSIHFCIHTSLHTHTQDLETCRHLCQNTKCLFKKIFNSMTVFLPIPMTLLQYFWLLHYKIIKILLSLLWRAVPPQWPQWEPNKQTTVITQRKLDLM